MEEEAHRHNLACLQPDVIDMGDDGDGYEATEIIVCIITGEVYYDIEQIINQVKGEEDEHSY